MRVLYQNRNCLCALALLCALWASGTAEAAEPLNDRALLEAALCRDHESPDVTVRFMESGNNHLWQRFNPLRLGLGGLMYVYQRYISPQLPSECLYHPSCSGYSKELIKEYGLIPGMFATADRLMRCNRMAAVDIHPLEIRHASGKVNEDVHFYKIRR